MELFHGTGRVTATTIVANNVDVALGGGELGQGFYTGDLAHEAFNWAWHKHRQQKAVVKFNLNDNDFINLTPLSLNYDEAKRLMVRIKGMNTTRSYLSNQNAIWAPVVGRLIKDFNQIKFEGMLAQNFLNGSMVTKDVYL